MHRYCKTLVTNKHIIMMTVKCGTNHYFAIKHHIVLCNETNALFKALGNSVDDNYLFSIIKSVLELGVNFIALMAVPTDCFPLMIA